MHFSVSPSVYVAYTNLNTGAYCVPGGFVPTKVQSYNTTIAYPP